MNLSVSDFESLLSKARNGDSQAMAELIAQYETEVRLVARVKLGKLLRPYLDSVDLVQSVHRSLMLGLKNEKFDIASPENLVALASTIVRRKVARQWRKLRRQVRLDGVSDSDEKALPSILAALTSTDGDPASIVAARDQIEQFLDELKPQERSVMELRLEGYSTVDTARQLGLDADVLRVQLSRLRQRLKRRGLLNDWL